MIVDTETRVTLALGLLVRAYPEEFSKIFAADGVSVGTINPESVEVERRHGSTNGRTDVRFNAGGRLIIIEAKVDAEPDGNQIRAYLAAAEDAFCFLLVPEAVREEAEGEIDGLSRAHVISWESLLTTLKTATPIAADILNDMQQLQSVPSSKAKQRAAMKTTIRLGVIADADVKVGSTGQGWPSINVEIPRTYAFGQIEGSRKAKTVLVFRAVIGLRIDHEDYTDEKRRKVMRSALQMAGERLTENSISFLRNTKITEQSRLLEMIDTPYLARGYKNDYAGVRLPTRDTADKSLVEVLRAARIYAAISEELWPFSH